MIKAIIFDMDGTLIDSEILKAKAWKSALEDFGVHNGDEFYKKNLGSTSTIIAEQIIKEFGLKVHPEEIVKKRKEYYEILMKKGVEPIHSTIEFLKSLTAEKIKIGLASSERKDIIEEQLIKTELINLFDSISSGKDEIEKNKPDPSIYLLTAYKLGVKPEECIVIEDSVVGVIAAKSAGMMCIGYKNPHSGEQNLSNADFVVNDLSLAGLSGIFKYLFSTFKIMTDKVKNIETMEKIAEGLKADHKIIVTTNGSFDVLHAAHVNLLEKAKAEGDILIVLLNSDASIKRNKGPKRPIVPEVERAKMLSALLAVDYVVVFDEDRPLKVLGRIKPNKHIKGGSGIPERYREEEEFVASWGGKYINFPLEEGFSTTNIINKILGAHR